MNFEGEWVWLEGRNNGALICHQGPVLAEAEKQHALAALLAQVETLRTRLGIVGTGVSNVAAFVARYLFIVMLVRSQSPIRANTGFVAKILAAGVVYMAALGAFGIIPAGCALARRAVQP